MSTTAASPLAFKILGSLEVTDHDGQKVVVRGLRRRALVLRLLVRPNQVVSSDALVEDVWAGDPPVGAVGTLQSHVSLLRRLVGPRLRSQPPGYLLEVGDRELDSIMFEADLAEGRRSLERGAAGPAADTLGRALGRWRGRAFLDVADAPWALAASERLEQLRVNGVELAAEALLLSGRVDEAVSLSDTWVAEHPLRERLWAHLMVGLTRQGRQADALRAYQRLRHQLGEQLGIEPSPSLLALEDAILMQRPTGDVWQPTADTALVVEPEANPVTTATELDGGKQAGDPADGHDDAEVVTYIDLDDGPADGQPTLEPTTVAATDSAVDPALDEHRPGVLEPSSVAGWLESLGLETAAASPVAPSWHRAPAVSRPLNGHRVTPAAVGREREIKLADRAIQAVKDHGQPRAVVVTGRPGMGRSTVVGEITRRAQADGFMVASTRFGKAVHGPLCPFATQLDQLGDAGALNNPIGGRTDQLRSLASELDRWQPGSPGGSVNEQAAAVATALIDLCQQRPICLELRDIHKAEPEALEFLKRVAVICWRVPILLVLSAPLEALDPNRDPTTRPTLASLLLRIRRDDRTTWIELDGLDESALAELVTILRGHEVDAATIGQHLSTDTGGNPLLASELIRAEAGIGGPGLAAPPTVVAFVNGQVHRLSVDAMEIVSVAALIGRPVEIPVLAAIVGRSDAEVLEALEDAARLYLADDEGRAGFRIGPPVVARVLARRLGPSRRAMVHRQIARVLSDWKGHGGASPQQIADHWLSGGRRSDAPEMFEWSRRAARVARADRNLSDALQWYGIAQRTSELTGTLDAAGRAELLIEQIETKSAAGLVVQGNLARAAVREARASGDATLLARAVLAPQTSVIAVIDGPYRSTRQAAVEALASLPSTETDQRARLLATLAAHDAWSSAIVLPGSGGTDGKRPQPAELVDEALALMGGSTDSSAVVDVMCAATYALQGPASLGRRLATSDRAVRAACNVTSRDQKATAALTRLFVVAETGNGVEVERQLHQLRRLAAPHNLPRVRRAALVAMAWRGLLNGDTRGTRQRLQRLRDSRPGTPTQFSSAGYLSMSATVLAQQGRDREVLDVLGSVRSTLPDLPTLRAGIALYAAKTGEYDLAHQLVGEAVAQPSTGTEQLGWLTGQLALGEAASLLGRRDAAGRLLETLAPLHARVDCGLVGHSFMTGPVATCLGRLAATLDQHDRAEEHFREAVEIAARLRSPYFEAQAHLAWAELLQHREHRNDRAQAAEHARLALTLAGHDSGWGLVADVHRLLSNAR